jgi:hypothetical protein
MGCHPNFDPYGLSLENFDTIGQYRTTDAQGRPIDASVKLPDSAGGAMVNGAADLAQALASGTAFSNCIAKNMLNYALADVSSGEVTADSCAASAVTDAFSKTDGSFTSLMREVALSKTLAVRLAGGAQ